jgi:hypothetical protein
MLQRLHHVAYPCLDATETVIQQHSAGELRTAGLRSNRA